MQYTLVQLLDSVYVSCNIHWCNYSIVYTSHAIYTGAITSRSEWFAWGEFMFFYNVFARKAIICLLYRHAVQLYCIIYHISLVFVIND